MASKTYYTFGKRNISDKIAARYPLGIYRVKQDGARYAYPSMLAADEEGVTQAIGSLTALNPGTKYTSERLYNAPAVEAPLTAPHPMAGVRSGEMMVDANGIWRKA